jgi:hypothetical protein
MLLMLLPVLGVFLAQCFILNDEEILGVLILGRQGEIERPRYHDLPVDDHDFVVGDVMDGVNLDGDSRFGHIGTGGILGRQITLVQNDFNFDPPLMGSH